MVSQVLVEERQYDEAQVNRILRYKGGSGRSRCEVWKGAQLQLSSASHGALCEALQLQLGSLQFGARPGGRQILKKERRILNKETKA